VVRGKRYRLGLGLIFEMPKGCRRVRYAHNKAFEPTKLARKSNRVSAQLLHQGGKKTTAKTGALHWGGRIFFQKMVGLASPEGRLLPGVRVAPQKKPGFQFLRKRGKEKKPLVGFPLGKI